MRHAMVLVLLAAACTSKREAPPEQLPTQPAPPAARLGLPDGPRGSITGTVTYSGVPPAPHRIDRSSDPACEPRDIVDESMIIAADGSLANVVVRLTDTTLRVTAPSEPVVVTQTDCIYRPRIQGAIEGQPIEIHNGDATVHNVHGYDLGTEPPRALYNEAQLAGAAAIRKPTDGRSMVKLACDIHPWMVGYVVVSPHPFFAVTGEDGAFRLDGVPAGTYQLEAWHEVLGTRTTTVEVTGAGLTAAGISFDPPHH